MGILTDFFVASEEELKRSFSSWLPVAPLKNRPVTNPLTGKTIMDWGPASSETPPAEYDEYEFDITQFPHRQYKSVDLIKLAKLHGILCNISFEEAIELITRPALLPPQDEDVGIHCLPENLTKSLSQLTESQIGEVTWKWLNTDELQMDGFTLEDSNDVVRSLNELACIAADNGKNLCHWWSL